MRDERARWIVRNAADFAVVLDYLRAHEDEFVALLSVARLENAARLVRAETERSE